MSPSAAANSALVQCGEGCKLFSEMHEVVWREFHKAAEYNQYKAIIEAYEDIELRYYKDYEFVIGEVQQAELTNNYFPSLLKQKKGRRWVIALSPDGQSYFKFQHLDYLRDWRWRNAKKITLAACNAISGRDDCVIYAENEKIYE
ncbi:hypothetical protein [Curvivirga aplysinae]|uniref:hypothetical protein n=1 Tax=Curvivirga aplysinae TaxID=2529852 RepID=UPI0012BC38CC|nr:hypothetical protein [Curvivirga aplysinae]MTI09688.1 hypothetical protein [Curvivirga aplysinae]